MGYAILDAVGQGGSLVASGMVEVPKEAPAAERLLAIGTALDLLIAEHAPVAVAVERLFFNRNARTAMAVAEARGVVLLCAARARLPVAEYTPGEVKLAVTGNGGADKRTVQRMVALLITLERPITADNVADAIAIALTHAQRASFASTVAKALE
ncbi:MAG: crossover junction endodeoxyribonuclease RuvC [Chloroflexi bacterium]|nr:crossover junction endodeoxyribonuclease RuvC [Chloroflexota bacterium]